MRLTLVSHYRLTYRKNVMILELSCSELIVRPSRILFRVLMITLACPDRRDAARCARITVDLHNFCFFVCYLGGKDCEKKIEFELPNNLRFLYRDKSREGRIEKERAAKFDSQRKLARLSDYLPFDSHSRLFVGKTRRTVGRSFLDSQFRESIELSVFLRRAKRGKSVHRRSESS